MRAEPDPLPESGYKSATNSRMTSDSAIFSESGDGCSGSDVGDPYTIAGTCQLRQSDTDEDNLERRMTDLARWVYSRCVPLGLVLEIYEISCHLGSCLLEGKLHL